MSYIGIPPFGQTVRTVTTATATAGQTTFNITGGYVVGYVDVFLNGVLLAPSDITATDGLTVVLATGAALNDEFQAISYHPVEMQDTYRKGEVDTLLSAKQDTLVSATNIKTINGSSLLGSGDLSISGGVTSVSGTSPVVSSGGSTPAISLASGYGDTQNPYASKTANYVLAAPDGSSGTPGFRALVAADIPTLNQNTTGTASNITGTAAIANGGTGQTTATAAFDALAPTTTKGDLIVSDGSDNVRLGVGADTYVLTADSSTATGLKWAAGGAGGGVTSVGATAPVASSGGSTPTISMAQSSSSADGYLSSADWSTFNGKQAALVSGTNIKTVNGTSLLGSGDVATGTVTSVTGSAPISSSGGATPAISISQASGSTDGYLSSADWTTFNGKGSGTVTSVTAGTGLSGGTITGSGTIALANTAVTAGSYTSANITVDAQGRLTAASNGSGGGASVRAHVGFDQRTSGAYAAYNISSIGDLGVGISSINFSTSLSGYSVAASGEGYTGGAAGALQGPTTYGIGTGGFNVACGSNTNSRGADWWSVSCVIA